MKKEVQTRTEDCWDCGGDGHHVNWHNGNPDKCYICSGTGKLPYGMHEWKKKYDAALESKYEQEKDVARERAHKYMKKWQKKNPMPTGKFTIISE